MRPKIICFFNNIDDAKNAFGQIKKESWNKASLAVMFSALTPQTSDENQYEFAAENFSEGFTARELAWPGVKETEVNGIGPIFLGSNFKDLEELQRVTREFPDLREQLDQHKVVTVVEVSPEIERRVRVVLESNGAEMIEDQANA